MPTSPPERLLSSTARSTFESLALLLAAPGAPETLGTPGALGPGAAAARVAFDGRAGGRPVRGTLTVAVSGDVAEALAENMLGAGAAGAAERRDAVGELANVICGHVLPAAAGPAAVFHLAAPAPVDAASDVAGAAAGDQDGADACRTWQAWLEVEGGRACVVLDAPDALFAGGAGDGA